MPFDALYRQSLALLTDLYQLTMALGYWRAGRDRDDAIFHLFFRKNPFAGGYAVACGMEQVVEYVKGLRFEEADTSYLRTLTGHDGAPLFPNEFLSFLREMRFSCDIDAVPEGTVVFAQEPLIRVRGPLIECQLLETALLNIVNFQTIIATKAARICQAAAGDPVLEFGLRRAHGVDGALSASRAAYIGGCAATSNVLAGKLFGIPVRGTHAHSWVMSFDDELGAFEAYAEAMPNNCVFLVDTYDTLAGVEHAIEVGRRLRERGFRLLGVRLDSGDLAWLSVKARELLDRAGFPDAAIVASNDLDERAIQSLKSQGAKIAVWGVGTKLVTAYDQPALGGVYKLAAIRKSGGEWEHKIKVSEQAVKTSTPGHLQIRRYSLGEEFVGDMVYDELYGQECAAIVDVKDPTRCKWFANGTTSEDLLKPLFKGGRFVGEQPPIAHLRERVKDQLSRLHAGIRRFDNPHEYPVGLEPRLHELKTRLVFEARGIRPPRLLVTDDRPTKAATEPSAPRP